LCPGAHAGSGVARASTFGGRTSPASCMGPSAVSCVKLSLVQDGTGRSVSTIDPIPRCGVRGGHFVRSVVGTPSAGRLLVTRLALVVQPGLAGATARARRSSALGRRGGDIEHLGQPVHRRPPILQLRARRRRHDARLCPELLHDQLAHPVDEVAGEQIADQFDTRVRGVHVLPARAARARVPPGERPRRDEESPGRRERPVSRQFDRHVRSH
jgi:hypothetical protein